MQEKRICGIMVVVLALIISISFLGGCGKTQNLEPDNESGIETETTTPIPKDNKPAETKMKDLSVTYKHPKFQVKLSSEYVYLGDKLELSISSEKEISEVHYLTINKDIDYSYINYEDENFYYTIGIMYLRYLTFFFI